MTFNISKPTVPLASPSGSWPNQRIAEYANLSDIRFPRDFDFPCISFRGALVLVDMKSYKGGECVGESCRVPLGTVAEFRGSMYFEQGATRYGGSASDGIGLDTSKSINFKIWTDPSNQAGRAKKIEFEVSVMRADGGSELRKFPISTKDVIKVDQKTGALFFNGTLWTADAIESYVESKGFRLGFSGHGRDHGAFCS
jgi:hypothetical protein